MPELQILICYNRPEDAVATYRQRWQIETCFRAMKSSGFNIEDTHLRDINRIARLTAMVCMALVWAYLVGEHKDMNVKAVRILKHGKRAKSLVKYGLEEIANVLLRPLYKPKFDIFKFLSYLAGFIFARQIIRLSLSWENIVSIRLRNLLYAHVSGCQFF